MSSLQILEEIQKDLKRQNIEPELFSDSVIFMSTFNDIVWTARNIEEPCASNSEKVKNVRTEISTRSLDIYRTWKEMKSYGTRDFRPDGKWNSIAQNFKETKQTCLHKYQCLESWNSTYD